MNLTVEPVVLSLPQGSPRSPGIHLSRIIRGIAQETRVLKPEWADDLGLVEVEGEQEAWWDSLDPTSRLRMAIGLAWEAWFIPQLPEVTDHPGEMHVDGIYMTPDGETLSVVMNTEGCESYELAVVEVKATYKSTKTVGDMRGQWMWLSQCKGYCKGLGATTAYLYVLFICGDYKYPISPQLFRWRIEFTQEEIDANWDLMKDYVAHQQYLESEGSN